MLVLICGTMGSGKTLMLTILAEHSKSERKISNYKVSDCEPFDMKELLSNSYKKADIFLDEAYLYLESRTSMNMLNRVLSYVLFQSRKNGINFYLTAQLSSSVDIRFRKLADVYVLCGNKGTYFRYDFWNSNGMHSRAFLPYDKAEKYFIEYDTLEVVRPFSEMNQIVRLTSTEEETEKLADTIINEIREKFGEERITRDMIDYFFEVKSHPAYMKKIVYVRSRLKKEESDGNE